MIKKFSVLLIVLMVAVFGVVHAQDSGKVPDRFGKTYSDNAYVRYGNSEDAICGYNTTQTNDALVCGLSTDSESLILMQKADIGTNMALADFGTPSLVVANSDPTKYLRLYHNGTNAVIDSSTGGGLVFGSGSATGTGAFVAPVNGVGTSELSGMYKELVFCGQNDENGTIYFGPNLAAFGNDGSDTSLGSTACDALDNATETTADTVISTDLEMKVHGMVCRTDGTLGAGETMVFTARAAAADVASTDDGATNITCSLSAAQTMCRSNVGSTTNIAAGAALALKVVQASNNSDDNATCSMLVSFP